jgi:thiosulfate/3-mercaptopyruvate sulfurtransferase
VTLGPLVDAAWLASQLDDVIVADVRWYLDGRSGREAHERGHIPGAVFVDLTVALAGPVGSGPGRHPLPSTRAFARALGALGIGDGVPVVAYDDAGGSIAARLWWMLRATGHDAAVLDGGIAAWTDGLETKTSPRVPASLTVPDRWPASVASAEDVAALLASGSALVVDARAAERYRGELEPIDSRAGHIPGARSAPWSANLGADGRFLEPDALRTAWRAHGVDDTTTVVAYCGSGVTACHDLLALAVAGLPEGRLYEGSWSHWSAQPDRPIAVGPDSRGG